MLKGRSSQSMTADWQVLFDGIEIPSNRYKLSRLLRWLSSQGISPKVVQLSDLEKYRSLLVEATLIKDVDRTLKVTFETWNRMAKAVSGWPQILIEREPKADRVTFDWSFFPATLKGDVDRWLGRLAGVDFLDAEGPIRPLRPETLKALEYSMRAFASALVRRGRDPTDLVSIAACLTIENYKEGLRFFYERMGKTPGLAKVAERMKSTAKHWVKVDSEVLSQMDDIASRLATEQTGMTQKNRTRLRATDDPGARARLRSLPWTLQAEVDGGKHGPLHSRVLAQMAAIVAIEFVALLRVKNLAAIEIGRHLIEVGSKLMIVVPKEELKNRKLDLAFEMPDAIADLIRWYIDKYRVADADCPYLFPGTRGRAKAIRTIQSQIIETIHTYTGLAWNIHLFRHFGAKEFLGQNPAGHEVVRQVLGHTSIQTTTRAYAGLEMEAAARHFGEKMMERRAASKMGRE